MKINQNENPWDAPAAIKAETLRRLDKRQWSRYPDFIPVDLHRRLAQFASWQLDGVLAGNGSNELIQALLIRTPCLQRAAGHVQHLGGLTLREALGFETAIPFKQLGTFDALPALVTITVAPWLRLNDSAHSSLLTSPWFCVNVMAKDGEGAPLLQPFLGRHLYEVADAMIEAQKAA